MNYVQRRNKKGLDKYTVSKEIGISYDFYCDVEKGLKTFNNQQLDKYLQVLNNAKELKLEKINVLNNMKRFYELDKDNNSIAKTKLKEFNINQSDLANKMNVSSPAICALLKDFTKASYELSYRVYDYLNGYNQEQKLDITAQDKREKVKFKINGTVADIKEEVDRVMSKPINEVKKEDGISFQEKDYTDNQQISSMLPNNEPTIDYSDSLKMQMQEFEISMLKQKLEMISKIINM